MNVLLFPLSHYSPGLLSILFRCDTIRCYSLKKYKNRDNFNQMVLPHTALLLIIVSDSAGDLEGPLTTQEHNAAEGSAEDHNNRNPSKKNRCSEIKIQWTSLILAEALNRINTKHARNESIFKVFKHFETSSRN